MNAVNQTLYIPLYGKAQVSKKGRILSDPKAEEIWEKEQFALGRSAKSKWLTYFMAMRAKVFDDWTTRQIQSAPQTLVLHIGCGMDSRILRAGGDCAQWYDIDLPNVIAERKKYYSEDPHYRMIGADVSKTDWLGPLPGADRAVVLLEGVSMYLHPHDVAKLFFALQNKFRKVHILMDAYTVLGAKASKYKNPIHTVGVARVYGIANPCAVLPSEGIAFTAEHCMTPQELVDELPGWDRRIFKRIFAGSIAQRIYRLYEYATRLQ